MDDVVEPYFTVMDGLILTTCVEVRKESPQELAIIGGIAYRRSPKDDCKGHPEDRML